MLLALLTCRLPCPVFGLHYMEIFSLLPSTASVPRDFGMSE